MWVKHLIKHCTMTFSSLVCHFYDVVVRRRALSLIIRKEVKEEMSFFLVKKVYSDLLTYNKRSWSSGEWALVISTTGDISEGLIIGGTFWWDDKKKLKEHFTLIVNIWFGTIFGSFNNTWTHWCVSCMNFDVNFFFSYLHSTIFFDLFTIVKVLLRGTWWWQLVHVAWGGGVITSLCNICRLNSFI